jgi:hypothetical protein
VRHGFSVRANEPNGYTHPVRELMEHVFFVEFAVDGLTDVIMMFQFNFLTVFPIQA